MTVPLSDNQREALKHQADEPLRIVDDRDNAGYVLLPVEAYEQLRHAAEELDMADAYRLQMQAIGDVWSDPAMDVYDHYDEHSQR